MAANYWEIVWGKLCRGEGFEEVITQGNGGKPGRKRWLSRGEWWQIRATGGKLGQRVANSGQRWINWGKACQTGGHRWRTGSKWNERWQKRWQASAKGGKIQPMVATGASGGELGPPVANVGERWHIEVDDGRLGRERWPNAASIMASGQSRKTGK